MRIRTLFLYLIGNRQAILDIASDRRALWIGALFVLSAAFAGDYDGEDLVHEPWHLLIPFASSIVASLVSFLVACGKVFLREGEKTSFLSGYRSFLTLFWMTAPLAWLYAIPYERFLSPYGAVNANLWTLALVAAWRVSLTVRVISVITKQHPVASFFLVMAFADAVALIAVFAMPIPIVSFMGGIRLTDSDKAIHSMNLLVRVLGIMSAPAWAIGGLISWIFAKSEWQVPHLPVESHQAGGIWALAFGSVVAWFLILPWTQREQLLRTQVSREMMEGRIADALALMSVHEQSEFPPQWDPPPRVAYREKGPSILEVMDVLLEQENAPWVRAIYIEKFRQFIGETYTWYDEPKTGRELAVIARILKLIPEGPEIAAEHREAIEAHMREQTQMPPEDRDNLQAILRVAMKYRH